MSNNNSDVEKLKECKLCKCIPHIEEGVRINAIVCPKESTCTGSGLMFMYHKHNEKIALKQWNTPSESDKVVEALKEIEKMIVSFEGSLTCTKLTKIKYILKGDE